MAKSLNEKIFEEKFESTLLLPADQKYQGVGGRRTKGLFKYSTENELLISIITVVYNGEKYLEETIKSVIDQTYDKVEYVIIDGGSTDGTLDIIKKYEDKIDYWVSEKDSGIYDAMNKGIDLATGEWINFMNSGDVFTTLDILAEIINSNFSNKFYGVIFGYVKIVDKNRNWLGYRHPYKKFENCDLLKENCVAHQASFTNRNIFKNIGKFSIEYKINGDYEFWLRAKKNNIYFKHIEKDIANFLCDGLSSHRNTYKISLKEKYRALVQNEFLTPNKAKFLLINDLFKFKFKNFIRNILGERVSNLISQSNLKKTNQDKKVIYDMSVEGATKAGVYIFAKNINNELSKIDGLQLLTFYNPFNSIGKVGLHRKIFSLLRLLYMELIFFRGNKKDIFFFPAPEIPFLFLLFKKNYIVTIHDIYSWKNKKDSTFFARIKNNFLILIAKKAFLIGTVSEFSKADIAKNFNIDIKKIFVINNGIHASVHSINLPIPQLINIKYLLNVGTLEPRKNIEFLIDVFENIKENYDKNLTLVLTGAESWASHKISTKISNSKYKDDILILGHVSNELLPWLYQNAQVLVFPSKEEGFGIPVIESLSQGTPVVVNKNSALASFEEFGATILDNYDIEIWSDTINSIIKNQTRVNESLSLNVIENFCWETSALKISEVILKKNIHECYEEV